MYSLPKTWQADLAARRARVESHWSTPPPIATARFIHEEASELQSVLNRLDNPELLRSVPLTEKDMPARELGQTLCMTGTLANIYDVKVQPTTLDDLPTELGLLVDWMNVLTSGLAYEVTARTIAGFTEEKIGKFVEHRLDYLLQVIVVAGDYMQIDPYVAMMDFLNTVEVKVEQKRAAAQ